MTLSVRFCLSYELLNEIFIAFKKDIISIKNCIVVTDVVMTLQVPESVMQLVVSYYSLNNSDVI